MPPDGFDSEGGDRINEPYLTHAEAAQRARMSPSSLYERNKQGDGPTRIKVGGRVLYRPEDVDRWLVAHIEDAPTAS